jgi:hypothetical protein
MDYEIVEKNGDYLKIYQINKITYISVTIEKDIKYRGPEIEFIDYNLIFQNLTLHEELHYSLYDIEMSFDDTYAGIFLWIDNDKKIKLYNNLKKEFIDITKFDANKIFCIYNNVKYEESNLEHIIKEILYDLFII